MLLSGKAGSRGKLIGFCFFVFLFFCLFALIVPVSAQQVTGKNPGAGPGAPFVVTVNGRIFSTRTLGLEKEHALSASGFSEILRETGVSSDFSEAGPVLSISFPGVSGVLEFSPGGADGGELVVVFNGKISRISAYKTDGVTFIPIQAVERILSVLGFRVEVDRGAGALAAVNLSRGSVDTASSSTAATASSGGKSDSKLPAVSSREQVAPFMEKLKRIFDKNRISKDEQSKFESAVENPGGSISRSDIEAVRRKYLGIRDEIMGLEPPDGETEAIRDLSAGVFDKMALVMEKASGLISLGDGVINPALLEEIQFLNRRIELESYDFNERVIAIRKKYSLGAP